MLYVVTAFVLFFFSLILRGNTLKGDGLCMTVFDNNFGNFFVADSFGKKTKVKVRNGSYQADRS